MERMHVRSTRCAAAALGLVAGVCTALPATGAAAELATRPVAAVVWLHAGVCPPIRGAGIRAHTPPAQSPSPAVPALPVLPAPPRVSAPSEPAPAPTPAAPPLPRLAPTPPVPVRPPAPSSPAPWVWQGSSRAAAARAERWSDLSRRLGEVGARLGDLSSRLGDWPDRAFPSPADAGAQGGAAGGEQETAEITFSDPSRVGTLEVQLFQGSVRVTSGTRKDVRIRVRYDGPDGAFEREKEPPPPGMRRLTPPRRGALAVEENANRITIRSANVRARTDLELEVPERTNLKIGVVTGGAIEVSGVEGDFEVNNVNGPVRLRDVSGSVVASGVNGEVVVVMKRVTAQKVMAFSSLNGRLDVTLPASTKANLKLRSDNGDIFTDFDVAVKTDVPPEPVERKGGRRRFQIGGYRTIYGTINGGGPEIEARSFNGGVFIRKGS